MILAGASITAILGSISGDFILTTANVQILGELIRVIMRILGC
jgi:hypothetical protein